MKEWEELTIEDFDRDYLIFNKYEFKMENGHKYYINNSLTAGSTVELLTSGKTMYYRNPDINIPSHEEILTMWWNFGQRGWVKIICYTGELYYAFDPLDRDSIAWQKHQFTNRESAVIPPEVL